MQFKKATAMMILLMSLWAPASGESTIIAGQVQEKPSLKIVRQTKEQAKELMVTLLANTESPLKLPPRIEAKNKAVFGKPIAELLPVDKIASIFIPYGLLGESAVDESPSPASAKLTDDQVLAALTQSQLMAEADLHKYQLAPWTTLTITMVDGTKHRLELMLGGGLGFLVLSDGQVYGVTISQCQCGR
jgi:hypothetical protein